MIAALVTYFVSKGWSEVAAEAEAIRLVGGRS